MINVLFCYKRVKLFSSWVSRKKKLYFETMFILTKKPAIILNLNNSGNKNQSRNSSEEIRVCPTKIGINYLRYWSSIWPSWVPGKYRSKHLQEVTGLFLLQHVGDIVIEQRIHGVEGSPCHGVAQGFESFSDTCKIVVVGFYLKIYRIRK